MPPKSNQTSRGKNPKKNNNPKPRKRNVRPPQRNGFVMAPSAIGGTVRSMPPQYVYKSVSGDARIRVHHREQVADIIGSVAFATNKFELNPGLSATFPWEYMQARLYESYMFDNLTVEYIPMKGADKDGRVSLAIDFDAADADPISMAQVNNYHLAASDRIWNPIGIQVDRRDLEKFGTQRYVRAAAVAGTDIKTYDVGNLYVSTIGCADGTTIGTIFLEFDVWLMTPQLVVEPEVQEIAGFCEETSTAITHIDLVGSAAIISGALDITLLGNTFTFADPGYYLCAFDLNANSNITGFTFGGTATIKAQYPYFSAGGTEAGGFAYIQVVAANETLQISDIGAASTLTQFYAMIAETAAGLTLKGRSSPLFRPRSLTEYSSYNSIDLPVHRIASSSLRHNT